MNLFTIRATLACFAATVAFSAQAQQVQLNLGHTLAPDSHYQFMSERMADLVAKKSNGEMKLNLFPQSQLGGEVKMIQAGRTGGIDLFITAQAPLTNTVKAYSLFDVPYLFDSVDQANKVLSGPVGKEFLAMLPQYNLVGLGFLSVMERNVFSAKPINKGSDMAGMKLRVMQSPGYVKAYESFGSQPTPMAYGDLYMALQQGVVDGADTSPDQFLMDKFVEVSKFYNITRVHYLPALLIASKSKFDSLTPKQKQIVQDSANEALEAGREFYKKSYADSLDKMKKAGVRIVQTDIGSMKLMSSKTNEPLLSAIPDGKALFQKVQDAKSAAK
jgi:tripartite ATP-independent transporter DctP family solute receptor